MSTRWPDAVVDTPAVRELRAAHDAGDAQKFYAVLDEDWLELWYAFEPGDLRMLIQGQPAPATLGPSAALLVRLTGAAVTARITPRVPRGAGDARTQFKLAAHDIGRLRLLGRPFAALQLIDDASTDLQRVSGAFLDAADGLNAMFGLQAGSTALLAGDLVRARGYFLRAAMPSRPRRFPFALRDVAAKTALTHAVGGDMGEARSWAESARALGRRASWTEELIDDTLWLVDYLLAIETLDVERAEQLRLEKPSPLAHGEWWGLALQAQVRHLGMTGRRASAVELCDAVAAAGLPQAGADGWQAVILAEARVMSRAVGDPLPVEVHGTPLAALARRVDEFAEGRFDAVAAPVETEYLELNRDARPALALLLLRAQALHTVGRTQEARTLLAETLEIVLARGLYALLGFLVPGSLEMLGDGPAVTRVREALGERELPQLRVPSGLRTQLSPAEVEVVRLLVRGHSRVQIGQELHRSLNTVKSQLAIYRKLGVRTRAEAVAAARQLGL